MGTEAPSSEQLFTRGGPNVPDNRGLSMVAKHMEKQQKEKEARAMERLHLLLPALGPTVRAVALQECNWDEERALTMLRRFQVAKVDELSKLHKERRRHQMALQSGKLEKRRRGKSDASGTDSGSGSGSDSESGSGSDGSSGSGSSSGDERSRRKSSKRKRSRSRERSSKRSKKERKEKRGSKDKKRKKEKRSKKDRKERRSKDKAKAKQPKGVVGSEYGRYGIIRETDMYSKRPEFQLWAMEVKNIDIEAMPRSEEKEMFKDFMEEYNTASLPHKKYYDLEVYEKQQAAKAARKGGAHGV